MVRYSIAIFVLLSSVFMFSCGVDFSKKNTEKKDISGKVIEKYRDEHNHMETTIVYENKDGQFKYQISDWAIKSDLWDYLEVGDSIIKPTGTLTLQVKKANGESKEYQYQR